MGVEVQAGAKFIHLYSALLALKKKQRVQRKNKHLPVLDLGFQTPIRQPPLTRFLPKELGVLSGRKELKKKITVGWERRDIVSVCAFLSSVFDW